MKPLRFMLDDPNDFIQKNLAAGRFYEENDLKLITKYIKPKSCIIDVGANVGNHCVYFNRFYDPEIIYAIEPIDRAYRLLLQNVALNYCHQVNLDYINLALSNKHGFSRIAWVTENNLGAVQLEEGDEGIVTVTGDSIFKDKKIDFIKIDVEGMEIKVLEGFKETIEKNKPLIFIEINPTNSNDFMLWTEAHKYKVLEKIVGKGCVGIEPNVNYLIGHEL